MAFLVHNPWIFTCGILGNIISVMVYLAPLPTFFRVYRKKSTEGFQSIPYLFALFSAMVWVYYALLKSKDVYLLLTVNSVGCVIETIYIVVYIVYSPRKSRILTLKLLLLLNLGGFCSIVLLTYFFAKVSNRVRIVGWICVALAVSVFAAPLSIMMDIRTKGVEFMPFSLSFFLTLSAILWFFYGMLLKDLYIAIPNILGFIFGVIQMILYLVYKNSKKPLERTIPEHVINMLKLSPVAVSEVHLVSSQLNDVKEESEDPIITHGVKSKEPSNQVPPK